MAVQPITPSERALTLGQLQTPSNQVARSTARGGGVTPQLPSQQFSIQAGLEQLTEAEQGALRKVVARLRARQQGGARLARGVAPRGAAPPGGGVGQGLAAAVGGRLVQPTGQFIAPTLTPGLVQALRGFFQGT